MSSFKQFKYEGLNILHESLLSTGVLSEDYRQRILGLALTAVGEAYEAGKQDALREAAAREQIDALEEWCPICKTYHFNPGEKSDSGKVTRECPEIPSTDPRNRR